ncbi:hypothetical protein TWF281_003036 [Arthrobotrys megalospora]
MDNAKGYYAKKGYKEFFATEELTESGSVVKEQDQVGITLMFGSSTTKNATQLQEQDIYRSFSRQNALFGKEKDFCLQKVSAPPAYAEEVTLGPESEGLDVYAVPDGFGNIEQYFIMGSIVVVNAPQI